MKRILKIVFTCLILLFTPGCQNETLDFSKSDIEILADLKTNIDLGEWKTFKIKVEKKTISNPQKEIVNCTLESVREGDQLVDRVKKIQEYKMDYLNNGNNTWKLQYLEETTNTTELAPMEGVKREKIELQLGAIFGMEDITSETGRVRYKIDHRETNLKEKTDNMIIILKTDNKTIITCEFNYEFIDSYTCWCLISSSYEKT